MRFSREDFNEIIPRFSRIKDFYLDYLNFWLVHKIELMWTIRTIHIIWIYRSFRAIRIFSLENLLGS